MPTFKFTSPDGKQYSVNGPEGATQEQAFQMLQSQGGMAAPAAAPAPPVKPFGEQLNDAIHSVPRVLGLTARYGLEGVGGTADFLATPFRAALNAVTPSVAPTLADQVAGRAPAERFQPGGGKKLADALNLPEPKTAGERVVGDATRMLAGSAVPIAAAARVGQATTGTTKAVAQALAANPVQQLISGGSAGAAGGFTRETGGDETSQFLASLTAGVAAPYAATKVADLAKRAVLPRAGPTPQQIDVTITNALQGGGQGGLNFADLSAGLKDGIRRDVLDAYRLKGNVTPDAIRRLADYKLTGATPTAGTLTLDPAIVTQQKNLAKQGINSKDVVAQQLGQTENANNRLLIDGLNTLGGGTKDTAIVGGRKVMDALADRNSRAGALINSRYEAARAHDGRSALLDHESFVTRANSLLDDALLGGKLPGDVRNVLGKDWQKVVKAPATEPVPGAATPPKENFGLPVDVAEQIKTRIGDLQRASADGSERKALGLVRQALDEAPLLNGQGQGAIDAFNKARGLNRAWMGIVEKTPALQAVRDGIEPDKFVQQFIIGGGPKANVADLAALRQSVKASPDAMKAVKEQIITHLKAKALNGAEDEVGNISQTAYNNALKAIGDEKLAMFFAPAEVNQMKAIGRVASYEQFQPRGAAVNNSNSAAAIGNIFDRIAGSSLLAKLPLGKMLQEPAQNISIGINSRQALNVPNALAAQLARPRQPAGLLASPALVTNYDNEEEKKKKGLLAP